MKKKYELTDETLEWCGHTLHQIKALKYFGNVKKGDMGGFVEKEDNLSQNNDCWVYDNAKVFGNANVSYDAQVYDNAEVYGIARVFESAEIYGNAKVYGDAMIWGKAKAFDDAVVIGNAKIFQNTNVYGKALVFDTAEVYGHAKIGGNARVYGNAIIGGNAEVFDCAQICGNAGIFGNAKVNSIRDYIVFKNSWSSGRWFTWTKSNNMWKVGCFYGTGDELIEKAYKDSDESGRKYEIIVNAVKQISNEE